MKFLRRLRALFRKETLDREMSDEMRCHLDLQAEANLAAGMSPDEARHAAQRGFGGVEQIKETVRDQRGVPWLEHLLNDLRHASRQLLRSPGFSAITILTVALGIGACTALFSVVNGVLLKPLNYPRSNEIAFVNENIASKPSSFLPLAAGVYLDWAREQTVFEHFAAAGPRFYNIATKGPAINVGGAGVTADFLGVFGAQPLLGRTFLPEEETPGKSHVAVLSSRLWQSQFGGRSTVLNETISLNNESYAIIGVVADKAVPWNAAVFTPIAFSPADHLDYGGHGWTAVGLLKPGVSVAQAQAELNLISSRMSARTSDYEKGRGAVLTTILEATVSDVRLQLLVLLGAVGLLLLIACVNVASLLLARANARQREIAVRAALGASRGRIMQQFLCESLLIAVAGGAVGVLIARGTMTALVLFARHFIPRTEEIALNGTVLAVIGGTMLLAGFGFGLVPGFQATRGDMIESLKDGGRGASGGLKRQRVRASLVVVEIALALMLLAGTGLLVRSLLAMQQADQGFKYRDVYSDLFTLGSAKNYPPAKLNAFTAEAVTRISALPDIAAVAFATGVPMGGNVKGLLITADPKPDLPISSLESANAVAITSDYFKVMSIPLLAGREFDARDITGAPPVVIINQQLAKKYFPNRDPIGQRLMILTMANKPDVWREVVGVVGDVKVGGPQSPIGPQVYESFAQRPETNLTLILRAKGPAPALNSEIRDLLHTLEPSLPPQTIYSYDATIAYSWVRQRFSLILFTLFAGVALVLAAIGIYGVMAYAVTQRTNEIGIRMALGAQRRDILQLVLGGGARIVVTGLLIGTAGALAGAKLLGALLYNTSPYDPVTFLAIALLLAAVALLACWLPARRATKVDPMIALRCE